jgi:hypothetical protein
MIALLFLGIIPGTNFQINFTDWLLGTAGLAALISLYFAHKRRSTFESFVDTETNDQTVTLAPQA